MALELPTLRIGLVGFTLELQERLRQLLEQENQTRLVWELAAVNEADVFLINGARTQMLADGTLRVASGVPAGRGRQGDPAGAAGHSERSHRAPRRIARPAPG